MKQFDVEQWKAQRRQIEKDTKTLLNETLKNMPGNRKLLRGFCEMLSKFPEQSSLNILLLSVQDPLATKIKTRKGWKEQELIVAFDALPIRQMQVGRTYTKPDGKTGVYWDVRDYFDIRQTDGVAENKKPTKAKRGKEILTTFLHAAGFPPVTRVDTELPKGRSARWEEESDRLLLCPAESDLQLLTDTLLALGLRFMRRDSVTPEQAETLAAAAAYTFCLNEGLPGTFVPSFFIPEVEGAVNADEMLRLLKILRRVFRDLCVLYRSGRESAA